MMIASLMMMTRIAQVSWQSTPPSHPQRLKGCQWHLKGKSKNGNGNEENDGDDDDNENEKDTKFVLCAQETLSFPYSNIIA